MTLSMSGKTMCWLGLLLADICADSFFYKLIVLGLKLPLAWDWLELDLTSLRLDLSWLLFVPIFLNKSLYTIAHRTATIILKMTVRMAFQIIK